MKKTSSSKRKKDPKQSYLDILAKLYTTKLHMTQLHIQQVIEKSIKVVSSDNIPTNCTLANTVLEPVHDLAEVLSDLDQLIHKFEAIDIKSL